MPNITPGNAINPLQRLTGDPAALAQVISRLQTHAAQQDLAAVQGDIFQLVGLAQPVLNDYASLQNQVADLQAQLLTLQSQLTNAQGPATPTAPSNQSVNVAQPNNQALMILSFAAVAALGVGAWWLFQQQKKQTHVAREANALENPKPKKKLARRSHR